MEQNELLEGTLTYRIYSYKKKKYVQICAEYANSNYRVLSGINEHHPVIFELATPYVAAKSYRGGGVAARTIFQGDIVRLKVHGEWRHFEVRFGKNVIAKYVYKAAPIMVEVCGFYFHWIEEDFEVYPMHDNNRVWDYERMEIIGTIHDNNKREN